ncbi:hypothetical protein F5Y08DRAFT_312334 [Xylaria arbuscula]|nr:hypothetical protein F5Y08DRAFT_312334 [Xylaria arbuscula]
MPMEDKGRDIAPWQCLSLDLPPSCIEFCPAHVDYFVVGTYNLEKEEPTTDEKEKENENEGNCDNEDAPETVRKPQNRNGSLVVFRLMDEALYISHVQTVSYPSAILDLHFNPSQEGHNVLATVSSTGSLSFFQLSPSQRPSDPLMELATHKPLGEDDNVLFLSCAWHPYMPYLLAVTTSDHKVHILRVDNEWNAYQTSSSPVITHTLEAWTVAFSPSLSCSSGMAGNDDPGNLQAFVLYSGGDDSKLLTTTCFYDQDQIEQAEDSVDAVTAPYPPITIKGHTAGVTAILPLPMTIGGDTGIMVTGSYDDCLRVYSIHPQIGGVMLRPPKLLAEENLGGGVWRLKLVRVGVPWDRSVDPKAHWTATILASCMHAGTRIVEVRGDYDDYCRIRILGRFEEHKSMNYGSDFQPGTHRGKKVLCVSTSFYDRLLCMWKF